MNKSLEEHQAIFSVLMEFVAERGRLPKQEEITVGADLVAVFGRGLDELVDRLPLFLNSSGPPIVRSLLPRYFNLLAHLLPVLQHPAAGSNDIVDPRPQRQRALAYFRECLNRISESRGSFYGLTTYSGAIPTPFVS